MPQTPSVIDMLKSETIDQMDIDALGDSALWILTLAIYAAERQAALHRNIGPYEPRRTFLPNPISPSLGWLHSSDHNLEHISSALASLLQVSSGRKASSPILRTVSKFSRLLRLLLFIPYRWMYIASGWMTPAKEAEATAQRIAQLLHSKPKQARESLLHAAQLFSTIRQQSDYEPYDTFILLMSALYIWYFDRFVVADEALSHSTLETSSQIIRLDQHLEADIQQRWIDEISNTQEKIHISGIGVLDGTQSVARVLREAGRIMNHDKAWFRQANAINRSLHQILSGESPSFRD